MVDDFILIKNREEFDKWKKKEDKKLESWQTNKIMFYEDKVIFPIFLYLDEIDYNSCGSEYYKWGCIDKEDLEDMCKKMNEVEE